MVNGSIEKGELGTMRVRFLVEEGGRETVVVYTGLIPDTFKDGSEVVVEGTYAPNATFTAHTLFAKCPSKYESEGYENLEPAQTTL